MATQPMHKMVKYSLSGFHLYANHSKSTASKSQVGFLACYHQRLQGIKEPPKMVTCEENGIENPWVLAWKTAILKQSWNLSVKTETKMLCIFETFDSKYQV